MRLAEMGIGPMTPHGHLAFCHFLSIAHAPKDATVDCVAHGPPELRATTFVQNLVTT